MLSLQKSASQPEKCNPNVLPCKIHQTGPVKVSKRFWSPKTEKDGSATAYFRGRKLRGRRIKLPTGYEGIIASSTDHKIPSQSTKSDLSQYDLSDPDEEEPESEPVKALEESATFEELMVWGHDSIPADDDPFVKGVEEWIAFAEAIHRRPEAQDRSESVPDISLPR